ncbi:MAG: winged helix-turn-helix transcriptional regulator [Acidobacteria bacterium]|nr:winged helix-turn-helix transcriptional regulator [Acidobacteriota bacterium]
MSVSTHSQTRHPRAVPVPSPRRRPVRDAAAPLSAETAQALAETFRVLGDPTRIRLIAAMALTERCVGDLATLVSMSESAVSHQLRMLRAARLVRTRRAGRQVFYTLDDGHILALFQQGLSHVHEGAAAAAAPPRRASHGDER